MNKRIVAIVISGLLALSGLSAQETRAVNTPEYRFNQGRTLFDQGHHAASRKYFSDYVAQRDADSSLVMEAKYYIALNSYYLKEPQAVDLLKAHLLQYPYSPKADKINYLTGRCYYDKKKYKEALADFRQVDDRQLTENEYYAYHFAKGYSLLQEKEYSGARKSMKKAADYISPYREDAEYYHAYADFCLKNYQPALEVFLNTSEGSRYYESAQYHALQIYDQLHQSSKAVELGKRLIAAYPNSEYNSEAYRILGENSYYRGQWDDVILYMPLYANGQAKVQRSDMYMLGMAYYQEKKYQASISALSKVTTEQDSLSQNAYIFIGHAYLNTDQPDKARMAFQSASLMSTDQKLKEEAMYNYALATYQSQAPFGEMIKAFEKFIADYPKSAHINSIYEHLADVYLSDKNYEGAIRSIEKLPKLSTKLEQAKEQALFQLGVEAFNNRDYVKAIERFGKSLQMYNQKSFSSQAYLWIGESYYRTGDMEKARQSLKAFLDSKQGKTFDQLQKAYYTLGYSHFEQKEYSAARPYFLTFLEIDGIENSALYPDVLNRLGDCYFITRDLDKARSLYDRVPVRSTVADYALYQKGFILGLQKNYPAKIKTLNTLIAQYPHSDYHDDAMYEIGRTYLLQDKNSEAVEAYRRLQKRHSKSQLTRRAALEIGMIYANMNQPDNAIAAYKQVIEKYPTSEETGIALESMQAIYIDRNQVEAYMDYREQIAGTTISTIAKSEADSISFIAAERAYARGEYAEAIKSLNDYIVDFCETPTHNCISAQYYMAESLFKLNDREKALPYYDKLSSLDGNNYAEPSLMRAAEITYEKKDYTNAKIYFDRLYEMASNKENRNIARLGILRCSHYTNSHADAITIATEIVDDPASNTELTREARYCRLKAQLATTVDPAGLPAYTKEDMKSLSADISFAEGAEAKYLQAQNLFDTENDSNAEAVIMEFIEQGTPHQYWLARCFILLSDIYVQRNDDFMAKQYLISLQENYTADDDIQSMISERIAQITKRENEQILP